MNPLLSDGILPTEVANIARRRLAREYPNGITSKHLRAGLKKQGARDDQIKNGLYKLTSSYVAEIADDGCYYLLNDPTRPQPPAPVPLKRAAAAPLPESTALIDIAPQEPPHSASDAACRQTLARAFQPTAAPEPEIVDSIEQLLARPDANSAPESALLEAIRGQGQLLNKARTRAPVARLAFKTRVLEEIGLQFGDPRLDALLTEIMADLAAGV